MCSLSEATLPLPEGPYADSYDVIHTGLLKDYGVREVSIAGYPEGHPDISTEALWKALDEKSLSLRQQGLDAVIITQFGFDTTRSWTGSGRCARAESTVRSVSARRGPLASSDLSVSLGDSGSVRTR